MRRALTVGTIVPRVGLESFDLSRCCGCRIPGVVMAVGKDMETTLYNTLAS